MLSTYARLRTYLALGIVIACGVVVFVDRSGLLPAIGPYAGALYTWAVILGAAALLLGVFSVLWVHVQRIQSGRGGWWQSLILVVVMVAVIVAGAINGPGERSPLIEWVYDSLIAPGYAALYALMAVFVAGAIYHMVRVGRRGGAWVLAGLLLMMAAQTPAAAALAPPSLSAGLRWLIDAPIAATLRGALLGVGLGLTVIAFRFVLGRRS